jgi:hypothetical protein
LCLAAAIFSAIAAMSLGLMRSSDILGAISKARAGDKKLEILELMLELEQISPDKGVGLYSEAVAEVPA